MYTTIFNSIFRGTSDKRVCISVRIFNNCKLHVRVVG